MASTMAGYKPPKRKNPREDAVKRRLAMIKGEQQQQQSNTPKPNQPTEEDETVKRRKKVGY